MNGLAEHWQVWGEWVLLLTGLALLTISETYQPNILIGLALLAAAFLARIWRTRRLLPQTGMEGALLLMLLSAGVGVWAAYDLLPAFVQFTRFIAGAVIFWALASSPLAWRRGVAAGYILLAAGLALFWPLRHDFTAAPVKFDLLNRIGLALNAAFPQLPGPDIHANVAAGMLLAALPFAVALAWTAWQGRRRFWAGAMALSALVISGGLLLTTSRGAWLALIGVLGLAGLAWAQARWFSHRQMTFWLVVAVVACAGLGALVASGMLGSLLGQLPDPSGGVQNRLDLWQQTFSLLRDYFFTGLGLQSFFLAHGIYGLLIHTPFIPHCHNTFLQVWLEQGILGAAALGWVGLAALGWVWRAQADRQTTALRWGALAALAAVALHGMVDVVFHYERTLPIIGLLFGLAAPLVDAAGAKQVFLQNGQSKGYVLVNLRNILLRPYSMLIIAALVIWFVPAWRAAAYANWGALAQTRLELQVYATAHFDNPTLDEVRRQLDLTPAEDAFNRALAIDPYNLTALTRLAEIALSRGEYAQALHLMQTAWDGGGRDDVTRLLYGDALLSDFQREAVAQIVQGLTWAEGRFMFHAFYRYTRQQDYPRALAAWQTVLLLNPQNASAPNAITDLQKRIP